MGHKVYSPTKTAAAVYADRTFVQVEEKKIRELIESINSYLDINGINTDPDYCNLKGLLLAILHYGKHKVNAIGESNEQTIYINTMLLTEKRYVSEIDRKEKIKRVLSAAAGKDLWSFMTPEGEVRYFKYEKTDYIFNKANYYYSFFENNTPCCLFWPGDRDAFKQNPMLRAYAMFLEDYYSVWTGFSISGNEASVKTSLLKTKAKKDLSSIIKPVYEILYKFYGQHELTPLFKKQKDDFTVDWLKINNSIPEEKTVAEPQIGESMFCRKCGNRIPADSDFCQYCGNKVINSRIIDQF